MLPHGPAAHRAKASAPPLRRHSALAIALDLTHDEAEGPTVIGPDQERDVPLLGEGREGRGPAAVLRPHPPLDRSTLAQGQG